LLKNSRITFFWQRMAPPHNGGSITCNCERVFQQSAKPVPR
jgi:hypothetical protein